MSSKSTFFGKILIRNTFYLVFYHKIRQTQHWYEVKKEICSQFYDLCIVNFCNISKQFSIMAKRES